MNQDFITNVYDSLQGLLVTPVPGVENAFEEGSVCDRSYSRMLEAYERLRRRLRVQNEDADVETIISSLQDITDELCRLMYEYGAKFGNQE